LNATTSARPIPLIAAVLTVTPLASAKGNRWVVPAALPTPL
jgi:hypothetical protein